MLFGKTPFLSSCRSQTIYKILFQNPEYPCIEDASVNTIKFIDDLLQKDPNKRLGNGSGDAEDIKNHSFFDGLSWETLLNKAQKPEWTPPNKKRITY